MFKRYELHNHTTQSDASITCEELIGLMEADQTDVFALTDHNTVSGHAIVKKLLEKRPSAPRCIYGMEYTTYYGHILCLNLEKYVPWDRIDRHQPELLFEACQAAGALTGVAHPFSYGDPFARGCRFEMTIHDFSHVDFIEVFNDCEPLHEVNERGLLWWEELTLRGERLAVTSGMDLHGAWDMAMQFATYAEGEPDGDVKKELTQAMRARRTWISKGPLINWEYDAVEHAYRFSLVDTHKPGFRRAGKAPYLLSLRNAQGTRLWPIADALVFPESELSRGGAVIPKLYDGENIIERLVCVAPVIRAADEPERDKR